MGPEVLLLESDVLGYPDAKLGAILIGNYLRLLGERQNLPNYIILLNGGVRLATAGSSALEHLRKLEERGVEIISCSTCVDYFGIEPEIAVGKIDGMKRIQDILEKHRVLTV